MLEKLAHSASSGRYQKHDVTLGWGQSEGQRFESSRAYWNPTS